MHWRYSELEFEVHILAKTNSCQAAVQGLRGTGDADPALPARRSREIRKFSRSIQEHHAELPRALHWHCAMWSKTAEQSEARLLSRGACFISTDRQSQRARFTPPRRRCPPC